jgi:F0F1-type ATP synthase assembly protein I
MESTPPLSDKKGADRATMFRAVGFAWDVGFIIAIPALIFGFGGAYADKHFGTTPLLMLLGLGFAMVVSFYTIWKKIKEFLK